ncbi:diguanylate cyclase domain-containing protein [Sphingomonas sp. MMS12-HWE2-04]|uniref:GGDEF domain-containing protein n=1 Tax=Sphingomonas sp. MMS12-HWE2-04 TaxID=3234199 RepID=UPI00384CF835
MVGSFRFLAALVACLTVLCLPQRAAAQAGVAGRAIETCVLRDTGQRDPADLLRHPERFDCTTPQHQLGSGDFWVISRDIGQRSRSRAPLMVRSASVWQDGVGFYTLYADGYVAQAHTDARGVTPLLQLGAIVEQPLERRLAPIVRVLWHIKGAANMRGIVVGARVSTADQSVSANLTMSAIYAGFAGLCIALIVYNLALFAALRHRFQLYYCLMAAGLLAYTLSSSGALAWVMPGIVNNDRLRINYLFLGWIGVSALVFARSFFEDRVFSGWLRRYTTLVAGTVGVAGAFVFVAAPWGIRVLDTLFTCAFLGLSTVIVPALWRAWRLRSNFLWVFALGWGAPILAAMLRAFANLHIVQWSFWIDNSTLLATAAEALLSAVAVAYRIKLLSKERDEALASEVLARRLADTDPLTGLLNRRAFLTQAIGRAGDQTLLIADLDHFKRVNETLGHDGGDEVLRVFARLLRTSVPRGALVARMGGEEFAVLADTATAPDPEGLLAQLRATRMPFDLQVTASIGGCTGPLTSDIHWKSLYRGADSALYDAKSAGRDRARATIREAA